MAADAAPLAADAALVSDAPPEASGVGPIVALSLVTIGVLGLVIVALRRRRRPRRGGSGGGGGAELGVVRPLGFPDPFDPVYEK